MAATLLMLFVLFVFAVVFATAHMVLIILVHAKGACRSSSGKAADAPHHHLVAAVPVRLASMLAVPLGLASMLAVPVGLASMLAVPLGLASMLAVPAAQVHAQETICRQGQEPVSFMCMAVLHRLQQGCFASHMGPAALQYGVQAQVAVQSPATVCAHCTVSLAPQHAALVEVSLGREM